MLLGLGKTLTFGQKKIYPYATGGDYVYLYEDTNTGKTYRVHEFLTAGVTATFNVEIGGQMEYLIVGGGGGGGAIRSGGGGAGGFVSGQTTFNTGEKSVYVGLGGAGGNRSTVGDNGLDGENSILDNLEALGGAGAIFTVSAQTSGKGSGAGGSPNSITGGIGTIGQGNDGGVGAYDANINSRRGGGGGGAGEKGYDAVPNKGGTGGNGKEWIVGSGRYFAGGGGGAGGEFNPGGLGGGGTGANSGVAGSGQANSGGGGGGIMATDTAGSGGSGIVIVRYVIAEKTLWTPEEIKSSSMIVWTDNTVLSGSDGDLISSWPDKGLSSNDLNVINPPLWGGGTLDDKKPRLKNNIKNSLAGLEFTKTGGTSRTYADVMVTDSSFDQTTANFSKYCQIYLVCSVENLYLWTGSSYTTGNIFNGPGSHYILFDNYDSVNETYRVRVNYRGSSGAGDHYLTPASNTIVKNRVELLSVQKSSNATNGHNLFHNGTSLASFNGTKDMTISSTIGIGPNSNAQYPPIASGEIMEFLYFSESHDTETRQKLEGYLAHKWGLTNNLPSGHPYKYEPPYKVEPEEIVTDGLVLNLDAGDYASYPRSGTTWYDISGNGLTGALTNGPTYDPANKGSIVFDGSNDYVDLGNNLNTTFAGADKKFSITCFFNHGSTGNQFLITKLSDSNLSEDQRQFGLAARDVLGGGYKLDFLYYGTLTSTSARAVRSSDNLTLNTWQEVTLTYDGSIDTNDGLDRVKMYINGTQVGTSLLISQGTLGDIQTGTARLGVGASIKSDGTNSTYNFDGKVGNVLVYDRVLSSTEIQQNFNALRGRYGV